MNLKGKLNTLTNNQLLAGLVVGLLLLFAPSVVSYYVGKFSEDDSQKRSIETVTMDELEKAIREAKTKIEATGYVLSKIQPDTINKVMTAYPKLTAKIVMIDPLARNAICQRQHDEDNKPRNYEQIILKVREYRQKSKSLIEDGRLKLGLVDIYPTMSVIIVDDNLYAYFFPYKALGTESPLGPASPVLKFINYTKNDQAKFFENHLNNIIGNAKFLSTDVDYQRYERADSRDPCFPPH